VKQFISHGVKIEWCSHFNLLCIEFGFLHRDS